MRVTSPAMWGEAKLFPSALIVVLLSHATSTSIPGAPNSTGGGGLQSKRNGTLPSLAATEKTD